MDATDLGFVPAEGRNVVYQIANGEYRPAQIVKVWNENDPYTCNLVVFLDGSNDNRYMNADGALVVWKTSAVLANTVGGYLPRKP